MTVTSDSMGSPDRFLALDDLCRGLTALPPAPRDRGRIVLLVCRRELGRRETPDRLQLTPQAGFPGDAWGRREAPDPIAQITVMEAAVARLIANGQPFELFGDNLFLDLDLAVENLPVGSRVRAGSAVLEVTPKPHNGCVKFRGRFGGDALRFVSDRERRHRNLRGIYMRVIEPGDVAIGDAVEVLSRPDPL